MISRLLQHADFLWALDHSTRRYRVDPVCLDEDGRAHMLRVVPLNGGQPVMMAARCELFPEDWEDSDGYASARLNAISLGASARRRGGVR